MPKKVQGRDVLATGTVVCQQGDMSVVDETDLLKVTFDLTQFWAGGRQDMRRGAASDGNHLVIELINFNPGGTHAQFNVESAINGKALHVAAFAMSVERAVIIHYTLSA